MAPSRRTPHFQVTRTSPVEVLAFTVAPSPGGQQDVEGAPSPSSDSPQKRYTEKLTEGGKTTSRALGDFEAAHPALFRTFVNAILDIPHAELQNGCPKLSRPDKQKLAAVSVELLMGREDPQILDAFHEALRLYRQGHFGSVAGQTLRRKTRKVARCQRPKVAPSSTSGTVAQIPLFQTHLLPPLDFSAIDIANASDTPISATESTWSSQSQTPATLSDGDFPHFFPPVPHQLPNAPQTDAGDFDLQWDVVPPSAFPYPHPRLTSTSMFSSRQAGNAGGMMYPGEPHSMSETEPYSAQPTSRPLHYPHRSFNSEEAPQAGAFCTNPNYFFPPDTEAVTTHLMRPQSRRQSTVWQNAGGSSRSNTYPPYQPGT